jgi:AcrR family transcriptional regulator
VININRYTSLRLNPSQVRGKERIRLILTTALRLFGDKGIDRTTTNDIAKAAHIPIGSVYRYFQNKEEIILAIADLQIDDVVSLFEEIAQRPDLAELSWQQTILIITDTWAQHARENDTFTFLYFLRCSHLLHARAAVRWSRAGDAYKSILQKRDPRIAKAEASVYVQLTWSAVELAIHGNQQLSHKAAAVLADYLEQQYPQK